MHDLNIIARKNQEALEKAVSTYRGQGRWVVCTYTGVTLVSIETFPDEASASQAFGAERPSPDVHRKLLAPDANLAVGYRDQSEDRTLADYIQRTAAAEGVSLSHTVGGATLVATAGVPAADSAI